jgi:hypothetical protein
VRGAEGAGSIFGREMPRRIHMFRGGIYRDIGGCVASSFAKPSAGQARRPEAARDVNTPADPCLDSSGIREVVRGSRKRLPSESTAS